MVLLAFIDGTAGRALGQEGKGNAVSAERGWSWWMLDRPEFELIPVVALDSPRITVDVGGSIREQYESYRNFELAVDPAASGWDSYHLHRLLVFADLHIEDRFRIFTEFGNAQIAGNERPTSPVDDDDAYIHQAFVEVGFGDGIESDEGGIRIGRQEIAFGSGRLFSLRDGPNIRRSFDAARLTIGFGQTTVDAFVGTEVQTRSGAFDNRPDDAVLAWGLYTTTRDIFEGTNLDAYYLGIDRDRSVFDSGAAPETRHSFGLRLWGSSGPVDYNFEPVIQFGDFGDRDTLAWTIASDTGIRLGQGDRAPRVGLRANIISGGHSEGRLNTFNALFPNNSYFSEAAVIAPTNLLDLNPTLTLHPHEDLTLTFMWDFLWRYDTDDAVYVPPGIPGIAGDATDERFIGHSLSISTEWRLRERLKLFAAYTHFHAGPAVTDAGGHDLDYVLFGLDWSF